MASRAPFPDSSASDPSGLKIRSDATKPGPSVSERSRTPSAPTPVCGSQIRRTRSSVSEKGSARSSKIA
jgi:hypothetical protein